MNKILNTKLNLNIYRQCFLIFIELHKLFTDNCFSFKIDIGDVSDLPGFRIRCQIEFVTIEHGHIVEDDGSIATTALYNAFLSSTCTDFTIKVLLHTVLLSKITIEKYTIIAYLKKNFSNILNINVQDSNAQKILKEQSGST